VCVCVVTFCLLFLVVRDVLVPIILYILVVLLGSLNSGTRILLVLLVLKARSLLSLRSDFLIVRFLFFFEFVFHSRLCFAGLVWHRQIGRFSVCSRRARVS
jgi:hypothetical protein